MVHAAAFEELADEDTFVEEVDGLAVRGAEPVGGVGHLARVGDNGVDAVVMEEFLIEDELAVGGNFLPVKDGDAGQLAAAGPLLVSGE